MSKIFSTYIVKLFDICRKIKYSLLFHLNLSILKSLHQEKDSQASLFEQDKSLSSDNKSPQEEDISK